MAMRNSAKRVFRFERFCLDLGRGSLRSGDKEIPLRPKTFDVLCYLAANAGRLVSKQELDEAVWPNVAVTDASLAQCIRELREKLEDAPRTLIKTVHRRGYMLDAVVIEETAEPAASTPPASSRDDHRSIKTEAVSNDVTSPIPRDLTSRAADSESDAPAIAAVPASEASARPSRARSQLMMITALAAFTLVVLAAATSWFSGHDLLQGLIGKTTGRTLTMFRDCGTCPEMVVLPPGRLEKEAGSEGERHASSPRVIAVSRFEITVEEFAAFVDQSNYEAGTKCNIVTGSGKDVSLQTMAEASFRQQPNKQINNRHPASCVSWHDARAYVAWLAGKTGKPYRLLTGVEWEYAARAGTTGPYSFEGGVTRLCDYARFADLDSQFPWASGCHSSEAERGALPVGSLKSNPWGLFDVHGNVWELVDDCISKDPAILPVVDVNAALPSDECKVAVTRGGGWAASSRRVDVEFRLDVHTRGRSQAVGFRVGLTVSP